MHIENLLPRYSHLGLLISLVFFFLVAPFFGKGEYGRLALDLSVLSILIISVYMCSEKKQEVIIAGILASPAAIRLVYPTIAVDEISLAFNAIFFLYVIYILLRKLFRTSQVTVDALYTAVSVYFLIGIFWGITYTLLEFRVPTSFSLSREQMMDGFYTDFGQDLLYYSFVTLATIGYGDIVALSKPAKFLSVLEGVMGQVYLTILVARLVGMHISQNNRS